MHIDHLFAFPQTEGCPPWRHSPPPLRCPHSAGRHILIAIDTLQVGGAQQHVLDLAQGLAGKGCRVTVLSTGQSALVRSFVDAGIPVVLATAQPAPRRVGIPLASALVGLVLNRRFDLIHAHLHGATIGGALASATCGVPLVVTRHSLGTWQDSRDRALGRWALSKASGAIAVSREIGDHMAEEGCVAHVIPNGVHQPVASRLPDAALRRRFGISPHAFVMGFVGRMVDDKDPLLFIETAAVIAGRCPSAHFLMIGDGPLGSMVHRRVQQLGLEGRFTFTGALAPGTVPFSAIDVLLLTSRAEGSPLVVLEAMAACRPVVAVGVGDVPDQIDHGVSGFVVRRREPHLLAARVLALDDRELRARLGLNGHARIARHFTLERMVSRTLALYAESYAIANTVSGRPDDRNIAYRELGTRQGGNVHGGAL